MTKRFSNTPKTGESEGIMALKDGQAPEDGGVSRQASHDFRRQLEGYGLTTAHILYRLPDYQDILQTYVWQDYDVCPAFPVLQRFLTFWKREIEGPLHSVTIAHHRLIKPSDFRTAEALYLH